VSSGRLAGYDPAIYCSALEKWSTVVDAIRLVLVIPPEPPVVNSSRPQRRTVGKGAPFFGAA